MTSSTKAILLVVAVGFGCSPAAEGGSPAGQPGDEPDGSPGADGAPTVADGAPTVQDGAVATSCATASDCTLAPHQNYARDIAITGDSVFWTVVGDGVIRRAPIAGGVPLDLASGQNTPMGIGVNAQSVFWTTQGSVPGTNDATVMSLPVGGGTSATLAQSQLQTAHMALTDTNLVWVNQGTGTLAGGSVVVAGLDGSNPITLAGGLNNANFVAADASYAYFTTAGTAPNFADGAVWCVPIGGGPAEAVASQQASAWSVVVDDQNIYWTNAVASGAVMSVPKTGGVPTALAQGQGRPNVLCLDDSYLYWSNYDAGTLVRMAKTGGSVTTLVSGMSGPESCVVDATSVYLTTRGTGNGDGSVMKVPK